ncbi:MAG: hypothetical protein HY234_06230 [Acidobacteria bacterium]|nr:hypothetical protein [Acidobacteriota bacterium]MBI3662630.1 hypothetical protein [Acidobacteriota bacterium]
MLVAMSPLLTSEELAGVYAKLERANENIRNLNIEITAFLKEGPAGGLSKDKNKALDEWVEFHAGRGVPPRFGVLAGEGAHHLRSSLDHIAWLLSSDSYRQSDERAISFPVLTAPPTTEDEISKYDRKVQGIASADALKIIERVRPYNTRNPLEDPLAIVHDLDRVDKHHAIVLVVGTFDLNIPFPKNLFAAMAPLDLSRYMQDETYAKQFDLKIELKLSRQVAFSRIGQGENKTVIPTLTHLENAVRDVIGLFGS